MCPRHASACFGRPPTSQPFLQGSAQSNENQPKQTEQVPFDKEPPESNRDPRFGRELGLLIPTGSYTPPEKDLQIWADGLNGVPAGSVQSLPPRPLVSPPPHPKTILSVVAPEFRGKLYV